MKAVILAAGIGSRIRPLTDSKPKSLLVVANKTILERMVSNIKQAGITQIAVVTGYLEDQVKNYLNKNFPDLSFTYIKNDKYQDTNTGYSLMLTKDFVGNDSFIKFDADVVFEKGILDKLINDKNENCLCIDKNIHLEAEEVKVIANESGKVLEIGKKLDPSKCNGESIGIEKIGPVAGKILFENLENLMKDETNYNQYYDDQYGIISSAGTPFYTVDITGLKWVEIDTHQDYALAKKIFS